MLYQSAEKLAAGVGGGAGLVGDGLDQFTLLDPVEERQRLANQAGERLVAQVVEHLHVNPQHAVSMEVVEDAPEKQQDRDAETDRCDKGPGTVGRRRLDREVRENRHALERVIGLGNPVG